MHIEADIVHIFNKCSFLDFISLVNKQAVDTAVEAVWHIVYKLFYWCLFMVETLEWLYETWDVHSRLFCVITSSKEEGMIVFPKAPCCHLNRVCQFQISIYCLNFSKKMNRTWKMRLCLSSKVVQWFKTKLDLFGTHAHRTERLPMKIFGTNMCTITPLIYIYIYMCVRVCVCVCMCVCGSSPLSQVIQAAL